jgi:hypothetical protein
MKGDVVQVNNESQRQIIYGNFVIKVIFVTWY